MDLTRNDKNKGKKRPICTCGTEMTFVMFKGYYDERDFWICENRECKTENDFVADIKDKGNHT